MLGRFRWFRNPHPRLPHRQCGQSCSTRQRCDLSPQSTQVRPGPSLDHPLAVRNGRRHTSTARARRPFPVSIHVDQPVARHTLRYQGNFPAVDLQPMLVVPFQVGPAQGFVIHAAIVWSLVTRAETTGVLIDQKSRLLRQVVRMESFRIVLTSASPNLS